MMKVLLCALMILHLCRNIGAEVPFIFDDLVGFGGSSGSANRVLWTNDGIRVVGQAFERGDRAVTAFIWKPEEGLVRLPHLSRIYPSCVAADINKNGVVVGSCLSDTFPVIHAIRWESNGTLFNLSPECPWDCEAHAVNNPGTAAGFWRHPSSRLDEAVLWNPNGINFLGTLGQHSIAYDITNRGQVVGESQLPETGIPRAVTYTSHGPGILGTLGGYGSGAIAANERGFVAGGADLPSGQGRAFLYDPLQRRMRALPAPENVDWAIALDINESNQVVGQFSRIESSGLVYHAFFWQPGFRNIVDLNELVELPKGWKLYDARGISDRIKGVNFPYIVGTVNLPDGTSRPYLLRPSNDTR